MKTISNLRHVRRHRTFAASGRRAVRSSASCRSRNGVVIESYAYDALGRRVATTTANGTERHVYDDNWQVIADLDANGNVLRSYVWDAGIDRLLAVKIGSRTYTAHTDVQGTVWAFSDEQGNVAAVFGYDAWGNVLSRTYAPGAEALAGVRYGFQGREHSQLTGFIHFRMRWYDPVTGRWLSKDPIRLLGGMNLYAFCGCDPVNHRDPIGTDDEGQGVVSNIVVKVSPEYWTEYATVMNLLDEHDIDEISQNKALQDRLKRSEDKIEESAGWWARLMNFFSSSGDSSGKGDADNNEKKPNMAPKKTKGGVK